MPKKGERGPTKLTPEVQDKIIKALQAGNYMEVAAAYAGIEKPTLYDWLKRGAKEKARMQRYYDDVPREQEAPFVQFSNAVERALSIAEMRMVQIVSKASEDQWQAAAWHLERMHPDRWGRRERVKIETDEPIVIKLKWSDDKDG